MDGAGAAGQGRLGCKRTAPLRRLAAVLREGCAAEHAVATESKMMAAAGGGRGCEMDNSVVVQGAEAAAQRC